MSNFLDLPLLPEFEPLNNRQKTFIYMYCQHFNGARAAREAGYSEKTANRIASENLTKLDIKAAIDAYIAWKRENDEKYLDMQIIDKFKELGFDETGNVEDRDKINALTALGKYRALFTDKVNHSGEVKIVDDL